MMAQPVRVGQVVNVKRTIMEEDIETFATLSLDRNPIHFDEAFASKTFFSRRIAHGMLGAALVSGALTELIGAGNIWLEASFKFENPILIGDKLTCTLTVSEVDRRGVAKIAVRVANDRGEVAVSGSVKSMRTAAWSDSSDKENRQ